MAKGFDMGAVVLLDYLESLATFFTHPSHIEYVVSPPSLFLMSSPAYQIPFSVVDTSLSRSVQKNIRVCPLFLAFFLETNRTKGVSLVLYTLNMQNRSKIQISEPLHKHTHKKARTNTDIHP